MRERERDLASKIYPSIFYPLSCIRAVCYAHARIYSWPPRLSRVWSVSWRAVRASSQVRGSSEAETGSYLRYLYCDLARSATVVTCAPCVYQYVLALRQQLTELETHHRYLRRLLVTLVYPPLPLSFPSPSFYQRGRGHDGHVPAQSLRTGGSCV